MTTESHQGSDVSVGVHDLRAQMGPCLAIVCFNIECQYLCEFVNMATDISYLVSCMNKETIKHRLGC